MSSVQPLELVKEETTRVARLIRLFEQTIALIYQFLFGDKREFNQVKGDVKFQYYLFMHKI